MQIFEVRLLAIRGDTSRQLELVDMIEAWLVHNKTQECSTSKHDEVRNVAAVCKTGLPV